MVRPDSESRWWIQSSGSAKAGPTVVSPLRDQVYGGGPLTPEQRAENSVVGLLAILFFVILAEGIFLAGSVSSRQQAAPHDALPRLLHDAC